VETTWDGLPVSREAPFAVCVVVWRFGRRGREFLVLHRLAPGGRDYEGDWAWTPPSGARLPGEEPAARRGASCGRRRGSFCRSRRSPLRRPKRSPSTWPSAPPGDGVVLDAEHDRFEWLALDDALVRCQPEVVGRGLASAAVWLEARETTEP